MDIVDAQVHLNHLGPLESGLAAMNALGIAALMFDEFGAMNDRGNFQPGELLSSGVFRPTCPGAEAASIQHPDRIGVFRRVHYRDPELKKIARSLADAPYAAVLRSALFGPDDMQALGRGELNELIGIATDHDLPIAILASGCAELLEPYAERFPAAKILIDHCGAKLEPAGPTEVLEPVYRLARHPNMLLKWSNAAFFLSKEAYPFFDMLSLLRRAVDSFGAERVLWGSDCTMNPNASWAEQLFSIRDAAEFSSEEKEWILGRTARKHYRFPEDTSAAGALN